MQPQRIREHALEIDPAAALRRGSADTVFGVPAGVAYAIGVALALFIAVTIVASMSPAAALTGAFAAFLPVPLYVALALWLDRYEREPVRFLAKSFAWGALVAIALALVFNEIGVLLLVGSSDGLAADVVGSVLVAPVIEEAGKGAAILFLARRRAHEFDGIVDAVVYAAMVGLGFAAVENVLYYGWSAEAGVLGEVFINRGIFAPFAHTLFTACFGLGLVLAEDTRRARVVRCLAPPAGFVCAVALHAIWNAAAVMGAFFVAYTLIMVPTFVGVLALVLRSRHRERELLVKRVGVGVRV
jgi:protease PrsW